LRELPHMSCCRTLPSPQHVEHSPLPDTLTQRGRQQQELLAHGTARVRPQPSFSVNVPCPQQEVHSLLWLHTERQQQSSDWQLPERTCPQLSLSWNVPRPQHELHRVVLDHCRTHTHTHTRRTPSRSELLYSDGKVANLRFGTEGQSTVLFRLTTPD
jgi:hypothetical protein